MVNRAASIVVCTWPPLPLLSAPRTLEPFARAPLHGNQHPFKKEAATSGAGEGGGKTAQQQQQEEDEKQEKSKKLNTRSL